MAQDHDYTRSAEVGDGRTRKATTDTAESRSGPRVAATDFIRVMVAEDLRTGKYGGRVVTRFPPEPNGHLHIGHAKSICLNFGIAREHDGTCNLRFDDTNPTTENVHFAEAIQRDVRWLGFDWENRLFYASDYFEQLFDYAVHLVERGKAYVDSLTDEQLREYRGTVTEPGRESPYRNRSVSENRDLFLRMRNGEFADGAHVLRAKIDMAAPNMLLRDPILYRIRHAHHYRTGDRWCVYPLYDFAHGLSDAIESVTHSLCTLEFKDNRDLYDWVVDAADIPRPRPEQTEFARLNLEYTVLSKRKLIRLVEGGHVSGWDDPRMPTLAGLRRRGVPPAAIRRFCDMIGIARVDSRVDMGKLEFAIRDELNKSVPRVMGILRPLKVVITNYPNGDSELLEAPSYPHDVPKEGSRTVPFSGELYIERDDFREDPPGNFHRLAPGREVRLRYAYYVTCREVIKDSDTGEIVELHCTYDPATKGGGAPDGRKVKGTLHWVSAAHALTAEVRLYDRLFDSADPDDVSEGGQFLDNLNSESLVVLRDCRVEPSVADDSAGSRYQFERLGYFCSDRIDSKPGALVFNRTVSLRDTWAKLQTVPASRGAGRRERTRRSGSSKGSPPLSHRTGAPEGTSDGDLAQLMAHYVSHLGLGEGQARRIAQDPALIRLFDDARAVHPSAKVVAGWITNELIRGAASLSPGDLPITGRQVGGLAALVDAGTISRHAARAVLAEMLNTGDDPEAIVERRGLRQVQDPAELRGLLEQLLTAHPDKVEQYRAGRTGLLGFFVGQIMRETDGRANPAVIKTMLESRLS